ncbi:TetR/AcrR family transcriptional regulator [Demequina soli]|uniref:TetR/AcrR family transcriptional regulator n=1 Tax=Demequina soli TaxID=1638987 RepID=UPI000786555D|nr:TetR family transcriptional regulator [Demequina soli]
MPRIDAPTVAEHHRRRRAALMAAGRTLLAEHGAEAVTPAAVGAAAGIARSSVYQYFPSSGELLAAIVEDAFASAAERLTAAMAGARTPRGRLDAYLRASFALATDSEHRMFDGIDPASLPPATRARIAALHREQTAPLVDAVRDAGIPEPTIAAQLVSGLLGASSRVVASGADPEVALALLMRAVRKGVVPDPA